MDLNSGPTIVTTGLIVSTSTSTTNLVTNGNFGTVASATPPAPWVESGTAGNGSVVLAAGDGRYDWTAGSAAGTTITQPLTVPANTSNTTVSTTNTATTTTVVTTTVTTADAITSIAFSMAWANSDTSAGANNNNLIVSYNGVTYATFETFQAGTTNAAGLVGAWTYSNGATGPATTLSVTNEATGALTPVTINLPAGVTASGSLVFRYTSGSTGAGSDDLAIDNVVATSTKTTTTFGYHRNHHSRHGRQQLDSNLHRERPSRLDCRYRQLHFRQCQREYGERGDYAYQPGYWGSLAGQRIGCCQRHLGQRHCSGRARTRQLRCLVRSPRPSMPMLSSSFSSRTPPTHLRLHRVPSMSRSMTAPPTRTQQLRRST